MRGDGSAQHHACSYLTIIVHDLCCRYNCRHTLRRGIAGPAQRSASNAGSACACMTCVHAFWIKPLQCCTRLTGSEARARRNAPVTRVITIMRALAMSHMYICAYMHGRPSTRRPHVYEELPCWVTQHSPQQAYSCRVQCFQWTQPSDSVIRLPPPSEGVRHAALSSGSVTSYCCTHPSEPYTILCNGCKFFAAASALSLSYSLVP